ncbi:MAG: DeoR/GlpR family DNA-binding transcription regulator [Planctomycetota bacterium]
MIALQRHRNILRRITEAGSARVAELARDLDVTEETIRRDLKVLAEQGVIARTHGGAMAIEPEDIHRDLPYEQRHATSPTQKQAIARAAVELIQPGQVVALDPSSTACHLARLIPDQPLTVVTNSLVVCSILADRGHVEVICTGGTLDAEAMAFFGLQTQRALETLTVEHLFFSCRGLDPQRGLSEANDRHVAVKLAMIDAARHRTLMVDTSKIGLASTVLYTSAEVADRLIVDEPNDDAGRRAVEALRDKQLRVEIAPLLHEAKSRA